MVKPTERTDWQRSSFCANGACVEVARTDDRVLMRDSKDPEGTSISATTAEWAAFVERARTGEFDFA
jgi:hypothetical protein